MQDLNQKLMALFWILTNCKLNFIALECHVMAKSKKHLMHISTGQVNKYHISEVEGDAQKF